MSIVKTVSIDASSAHSKVLARAAEALGEQQKAADGPISPTVWGRPFVKSLMPNQTAPI